jgi:signal recognition particle receptor subunit beta
VEVSLPVTTKRGSSKYRSANDPSLKVHKKFLLADTPGHGKLRYHAFENIVKPHNIKGIIFMVDAADLSGGQGDEGLRQTAEYLHDLLLLLQTRSTKAKSSRAPQELPVLIAANKLDLFTALPAVLVKTSLESEITKIRTSRDKGLFDSGVDMNEMDAGEEKDWLGGGSDGKFEFSQLEEFNVPVTILGGNVVGPNRPDVEKWWDWIGSNL